MITVILFSCLCGVLLGIIIAVITGGYFMEKERLKEMRCFNCELCDVRDDNGKVWCYKHDKEVSLDDNICRYFEEDDIADD